jgi:hypothetical protein
MRSAQANGGHCQDTDDAHCIVCGKEQAAGTQNQPRTENQEQPQSINHALAYPPAHTHTHTHTHVIISYNCAGMLVCCRGVCTRLSFLVHPAMSSRGAVQFPFHLLRWNLFSDDSIVVQRIRYT